MLSGRARSQSLCTNQLQLPNHVNAEVMCFEDERDLLLRWRDLVLETDPDVIIGYNIINFDLPYLLDRAAALGVLHQFGLWGRMRGK